METEYVPQRLIDAACRRQERKNLKAFGRSLSWVSMLHYVNPFCIEYQSDHQLCIMRIGWREKIKELK
jgi:hypothetical protein